MNFFIGKRTNNFSYRNSTQSFEIVNPIFLDSPMSWGKRNCEEYEDATPLLDAKPYPKLAITKNNTLDMIEAVATG